MKICTHKIYLSGAITGMDIEQAKQMFEEAEEFCLNNYPNALICNPMKMFPVTEGKKWQEYMHDCLPVLESCDMIYMLKNWKQSLGAQIELLYAKGCGMPDENIIFQ